MQRHLIQPEPSLELSVEEAAILSEEMAQAVQNAKDCTSEIERLEDIVVTVGDVETVVSNTPQISDTERGLIAAVADMAVAGSDVEPEDVMPTSADDEARKITTEGFVGSVKDKLVQLWEAIKAAIRKAIAHIKAFFSGSETKTKNAVNTAERVQKEVKELQQHHPTALKGEPHFTYKGNVQRLMYKGEVSPNIDQQLTALHKATSDVMDKTIKSVKELALLVESAASSLNTGKTIYTFQTFAESFLELVDEIGRNIGRKQSVHNQFGYFSEEYLGGLSLSLAVHLRVNDKTASIEERFQLALAASFAATFSAADNPKQEVPVLPLATADAVANHSLTWLTGYLEKKYQQQIVGLEGQIQNIVNTIDQVQTRFAQIERIKSHLDKPERTDVVLVTLLTAITRTVPFIAKMVAGPLTDFAMKAVSIDQEAMAYVEQSTKFIAGNDPT